MSALCLYVCRLIVDRGVPKISARFDRQLAPHWPKLWNCPCLDSYTIWINNTLCSTAYIYTYNNDCTVTVLHTIMIINALYCSNHNNTVYSTYTYNNHDDCTVTVLHTIMITNCTYSRRKYYCYHCQYQHFTSNQIIYIL